MDEAILVIVEHEAVRTALCERLKIAFPFCQVVEAVGNEEALALVVSETPQVVILDIGPQVAERLDVARRIKAVRPATQIVAWAIHDWENYRLDALAAGATAYVLQEETQDELLAVLDTMLADQPNPDSQQIEEKDGKQYPMTKQRSEG